MTWMKALRENEARERRQEKEERRHQKKQQKEEIQSPAGQETETNERSNDQGN